MGAEVRPGLDSSTATGTGKRRHRGSGRIVRLRRWLLGSAIVLVALLAGFIGYARHRAHTALLALPHLLGADIKSETDGYTYSQTVKGRTLFTIHAARAIQHSNGQTTLHNVSVTLYGEPGSNRVDRIRGAEFQYDQAAGVVRAVGESEIDLASPANAAEDKPEAKRIHVIANGLVFDQKAGTAATSEMIRFEYGSAHGNAVGADFSAHAGTLLLHHNVHVVGNESGHEQQVDADAATLDRNARTALLTNAVVQQQGDSLRAQTLLIRLRPADDANSNTVESIHGSGNVLLATADGDSAAAPTLDSTFSPQNHPRLATLSGGVALHDRDSDGRALAAVLHFNELGQPQQVHLQGAVQLHQPTLNRDLSSDALDASLQPDAKRHVGLKDATATGHAQLHLAEAANTSHPGRQTAFAADVLHATGTTVNSRWQLRRVQGDGNTRVEERLADGAVRTSTGAQADLLLASDASIESFVQTGRVHAIDHRPATGAKPASNGIADAERADYSAQAGTVVLTGNPVVRNETSEVTATRIAVETATGDADATGNVRGSVRSQTGSAASADVLHFLAARAVARRATQQTVLSGAPVRLWSATSQIEAPVVELDQTANTLFAHATPGAPLAAAVRTVLPSEAKSTSSKARTGSLRTLSEALRYHGATAASPPTADFAGGVRLDTASGQVQCDHAVALLHRGNGSGAPMAGGAVDTVTADGHVRITQPGRIATGTRLLYTAATEQFVLTGTPSTPPQVWDSVQGTVTGASLLFHAGDDSVEVTGGPDQPVRTDLAAPPRNAANRNAAASAAGKAGQKN